jgi:hypothetical protein
MADVVKGESENSQILACTPICKPPNFGVNTSLQTAKFWREHISAKKHIGEPTKDTSLWTTTQRVLHEAKLSSFKWCKPILKNVGSHLHPDWTSLTSSSHIDERNSVVLMKLHAFIVFRKQASQRLTLRRTILIVRKMPQPIKPFIQERVVGFDF